jgi:hypothetical protein
MSATIEQKAMAACRDYVRWQAEIKRISGAIGGHLYLCNRIGLDSNAVNATHLAEAYRPDVGEWRTTYMTPEDVVEYLQEHCPHCLAAHLLVQERKTARQKFGAAKRQVSKLGKAGAV